MSEPMLERVARASGNPGPHVRGRLSGFAIGKIRRLIDAGVTVEVVAAMMRVPVREVEQVEL